MGKSIRGENADSVQFAKCEISVTKQNRVEPVYATTHFFLNSSARFSAIDQSIGFEWDAAKFGLRSFRRKIPLLRRRTNWKKSLVSQVRTQFTFLTFRHLALLGRSIRLDVLPSES